MQPPRWLVLAVHLAALHGSSALQQAPRSTEVLTNQSVVMSCETSLQSASSIYWLRQRRAPGKDGRYEFLASWSPSKGTTHGSGVTEENLTAFCYLTRCSLNLTSVKPADSGTYFCVTLGSPELNFGQGTQLSVVDFFPTTTQPTTKTSPRRKVCRLPSPEIRRGPTCGSIPLSLLVAGIVVLLVSLSVAVRFHCLRKKARLRFMKQFYK
uniref:T-cell surface glycoprotein CD8 beta chain n=1 Tax=Jaculus jaculus TaxID=51337 RepID=UPI001E1B5C82|nr:T-cell surface glycoprotein CD8 beta chain [Jaculus jaculus]